MVITAILIICAIIAPSQQQVVKKMNILAVGETGLQFEWLSQHGTMNNVSVTAYLKGSKTTGVNITEKCFPSNDLMIRCSITDLPPDEFCVFKVRICEGNRSCEESGLTRVKTLPEVNLRLTEIGVSRGSVQIYIMADRNVKSTHRVFIKQRISRKECSRPHIYVFNCTASNLYPNIQKTYTFHVQDFLGSFRVFEEIQIQLRDMFAPEFAVKFVPPNTTSVHFVAMGLTPDSASYLMSYQSEIRRGNHSCLLTLNYTASCSIADVQVFGARKISVYFLPSFSTNAELIFWIWFSGNNFVTPTLNEVKIKQKRSGTIFLTDRDTRRRHFMYMVHENGNTSFRIQCMHRALSFFKCMANSIQPGVTTALAVNFCDYFLYCNRLQEWKVWIRNTYGSMFSITYGQPRSLNVVRVPNIRHPLQLIYQIKYVSLKRNETKSCERESNFLSVCTMADIETFVSHNISLYLKSSHTFDDLLFSVDISKNDFF